MKSLMSIRKYPVRSKVVRFGSHGLERSTTMLEQSGATFDWMLVIGPQTLAYRRTPLCALHSGFTAGVRGLPSTLTTAIDGVVPPGFVCVRTLPLFQLSK